MKFSHLHVHTQFSLLDGAASIKALYNKAIADGMPALAISDDGNMFGVFEFGKHAHTLKNADGSLKVKPIVGCEFYITENRFQKQLSKEQKDPRHHQILLAKNSIGYKNLMKLTSLGYIEGMYSKYPRIDKELIHKYHEGLIATTCCLGALVPQMILKKGEDEAENEFKWWLNIFQKDYYVELQRHGIPDQEKVNKVLLKFAKKYNVNVIASNDSHYVDEKDSNAHDILLCINTGEKQATPKLSDFADDDISVKNKRFAFPNNQFYLKNTSEMLKAFEDLPQALDNTNEIIDKIDTLNLTSDILIPHFPVPKEFVSQESYLEHLTWTGAKKRYSEMTPEIEERINFELFTIKTMGFSGYFLIVSDFIIAGKKLGVFVGPGRGSAAGSVVAYCIGITNIDPIKYNLLFERFLNPDRKTMPDIDTDFDDEGRQKVLDYVVEKYGKNQVAQIITYGTMAAKMSIKDVARVMDLPLSESNALAKLVPDRPGTSLRRVLQAPVTGPKSLTEDGVGADDISNILKLRDIYNGDDNRSKVLHEAEILEGSVRNTGIHASAIIIAPQDLMELIPVASSKDSDLWLTQIDGSNIESAGVLKMDFLGLKTLSILKTALQLIKQNHGVTIDLDTLPLDDEMTYKLYQRADTNGTFQFESGGMQKHLRDLKPDKFDDLIAMNALFRPGPMAYIPTYIERKHGRQEIHYDLPEMEEFLKECKSMGLTVLGPDINESQNGFAVNKKGEIRFGFSGMKGVGEAAIENIIEEREKHGMFSSIFDLIKRVNQRTVNKKSLDSLAYAGAFDCFKNIHRAQYFFIIPGENINSLEKILKFGNQYQAQLNSSTNTLFGDLQMAEVTPPVIPECEPWPLIKLLDNEKDIIGIYMSGHPLDNFKFQIRHYGLTTVAEFNEFKEAVNLHPNPARSFRIAGLVTEAQHRISKNGNKYGVFFIEDYSAKMELMLWSEDYVRFSNFLETGMVISLSGGFSRRDQNSPFEFKVNSVTLLESLMKSSTKKF